MEKSELMELVRLLCEYVATVSGDAGHDGRIREAVESALVEIGKDVDRVSPGSVAR